MGRENDREWYEACNPLHGTRGLVPVSYFEPVGKTVRDSGSSTKSVTPSQPTAPHDSGYAERSVTSPNPADDAARPPMRMSKSMGKGSGAMVYGIVMYDFKAERPDELEAKEGEAIIVIAQSNPEWFVAKPITRLGGPGLIPVSFIEIRDMTTGQAVPDAQEAVQRAGVPKVEEWKKMAADYKNGSIPLGKLETNTPQTLQQGMDRMSLSNKSQTGGNVNGGPAPGNAVSFPPIGYFFPPSADEGSLTGCCLFAKHRPIPKPEDFGCSRIRLAPAGPCHRMRAAVLLCRRHFLVHYRV